MVSILTALYFSALRSEVRVVVKPHTSPVFHAMHYLMGNISREKLETFRGFAAIDHDRPSSPPARSTTRSWRVASMR